MIGILLNYARSGATVFSKILASQPNVILLSEVNPVHNAVSSPAQQAKNWYNIQIKDSLSWELQILEIYKYCLEHNKQLIVRDFSFIDFTPHQLNNFSPKSSFSILNCLQPLLPLKTFCLVRNAIDVFISRDCPPFFDAYYLNYTQAVKELKVPVFKYEEFTENPNLILYEIGQMFNFNPHNFLPSMLNYANITGDNLLRNPSRGKRQNKLKLLPRKKVSSSIVQQINTSEALKRANQNFNYPHQFSENLDETTNQLLVEVKFALRKILGSYPSVKY